MRPRPSTWETCTPKDEHRIHVPLKTSIEYPQPQERDVPDTKNTTIQT